MAASLFDHPAVLLVIAAVALFRWLIEKSRAAGRNAETTTTTTTTPSAPITRGGESRSEEERIRKFLDALGQPAGSTPPKVEPRRRRYVEPQIFPKLPRLTTKPPPLPGVTTAPLPPELPRLTRTQTRPGRLEPDFEVHEVARQTSSEPLPQSKRAAFAADVKLGTPQDLRTAIVLREIFGPPRSLQTPDAGIGF
jgi:hypothetical protein